MGKCGCFFPQENSLISRGKSHISRVRGLVVRCLLFNPPFTVSGIVTFFKRNNFRVKIRFSQVRHAISDFCFKRPVFFLCDFLKICFTEAPPQFLPEPKHFARVKDSSRFSALCDLPDTIKNIF